MKSDLDRLMGERGFDAVFVTGPSHNNPVMYYLVNGATVGEGTMLLKKRGEEPVLFVNLMERDEAAKSGLRIVDTGKYDFLSILREAEGNRLLASIKFREALFADMGVAGKVSLYGLGEQGRSLVFNNAFNAHQDTVEIVGEYADTIFDAAWTTKDPEEVARIKRVGEKTMLVVGNTAEFLQSHRASNGVLVKSDGSPLTVADVKREIRRWLLEENIEDPEGVIFSIGRDAGVAHSSGEGADHISLGKTIVYDIFPREPGGGYFFDFTRTWCVGHAPANVEKAYVDVLDTFDTLMSEMKLGDLCRGHEARACDLLEARGHPTHRSHPKSPQGYYHSLGHGIGLNVHERPFFGIFEGNNDTLAPNSVVTVEPGVYYPDEPDGGGFGIRIEDCVWMNPATSRFEALASFSKELVLPLKS
jgi:Xaa-Pro aminopeptidase